jgi:hypothetical protein
VVQMPLARSEVLGEIVPTEGKIQCGRGEGSSMVLK